MIYDAKLHKYDIMVNWSSFAQFLDFNIKNKKFDPTQISKNNKHKIPEPFQTI